MQETLCKSDLTVSRSWRWSVTLIGLLGLLLAWRSQADTVSDAQFWLNTTATVSLDDNWRVWLEGQARFTGDFGRLGQSILRPGLGYRLHERLTVWAGYAYVVTDTVPGSDIDENRFWQQASWQLGKAFGGVFNSRTRLEQRWFSNGDDTAWRWRQLFSYRQPFAADSPWYWTIADEVFVALNDTDNGIRSGFDQNRLFIGTGYQLQSGLQIEGGYLNQYINTPGDTNALNHIVSLTMRLNY